MLFLEDFRSQRYEPKEQSYRKLNKSFWAKLNQKVKGRENVKFDCNVREKYCGDALSHLLKDSVLFNCEPG